MGKVRENKETSSEDHYLLSLASQAFINSKVLTADSSALERDFAHPQYPKPRS